MNYTELRLKIIHFFRKYKVILFVILSVWLVIVFINMFLKNRTVVKEPTTTYEPHVSVMDSSSKTPTSLQEPIEKLIENYVKYCNEGDYEHAFNMLSDDCREYEFDNSKTNFLSHVLVKMPSKRDYAIQNYSNIKISTGNVYIYEVKYTEDLLATGLTNTDYSYTTEKFAFMKDSKGNVQMSVGNYIYHTPIKSISENEYLKIDVIDKLVNYSIEEYQVKFTNRSENIIVIANGKGSEEVNLRLPNEVRKRQEDEDIVLNPGESITTKFTFSKFVDDGDTSQSLVFGAIRVMEQYSGTENVDDETIQKESDNAIAKFSMTVSVTE